MYGKTAEEIQAQDNAVRANLDGIFEIARLTGGISLNHDNVSIKNVELKEKLDGWTFDHLTDAKSGEELPDLRITVEGAFTARGIREIRIVTCTGYDGELGLRATVKLGYPRSILRRDHA